MVVYVDDMYLSTMGQYGRMKMSHMIADTDEELHRMADRIGVKRKWFQGDHYDISMLKRTAAIHYGAIAIPWRTLGCMSNNRNAGWPMGLPHEAEMITKLRMAFRELDLPDDDDIPF